MYAQAGEGEVWMYAVGLSSSSRLIIRFMISKRYFLYLLVLTGPVKALCDGPTSVCFEGEMSSAVNECSHGCKSDCDSLTFETWASEQPLQNDNGTNGYALLACC